MASEPQPAPQQLVFSTFNIIGRPPALLSRMGNDPDQIRFCTSEEPMPFDIAFPHSPTGGASGSRDLVSRMPSSSTAPNALPASPPTLATSSASVPSPMTPLATSARPPNASVPEVPAFSPVAASFEKGKGPAVPRSALSPPLQSSPIAQSSLSTSPNAAGTANQPPQADANFDYPGFLHFLERRTQSLSGVHNSNATRAQNWTNQARKTVTSGVELLEFVRTLMADADAAAAQAARAREEAARAEELASNLQTRVKEALSLVESLQKEHEHNRDLAEKVQQYGERLKSWDTTTWEKEKGFIVGLRNHLQTEEDTRSVRAAESARFEAARAEENAVRAQNEAARAAERDELLVVRAELDATKKKEFALIKERDSFKRAHANFLASIDGLRAVAPNSSGANDETRNILDHSTSLAALAAQQTTPATPTVPSAIDPTQSLSRRSSVARQTTSPAQLTSRPLVTGFVPAQTEAGRAVNTQSPLASTARTLSRSALPTPEAQLSSSAIVPARDASAALSATSTTASPDIIVKQEPEPDHEVTPRARSHIAETRAPPPPVAIAVTTPIVSALLPPPTQRPPSPISSVDSVPSVKPIPAPARELEPLREPSPMGPDYDGDHHLILPPERDYDYDERRSLDSHSEDRTSPSNSRSIDLRLPPKPQVPLPPLLRDERSDQPPSPIQQRASASHSHAEHGDLGRPVIKRKFGDRSGPPGVQRTVGDGARPFSSSVLPTRPNNGDGSRRREERERLDPGPSRVPPAHTGSTYIPSNLPIYERATYPSPRQGESSYDGRFNYNANSPDLRNARPPPNTYTGRSPDHYSPSAPIQRRPSRGGDSYRPSPPQTASHDHWPRDEDEPSRRNPPPRQAPPDYRPAPHNERPPALQARITSATADAGPSTSENRSTLEERMQTLPASPDTSSPTGGLMLRIRNAPKRARSPAYGDDNDERDPKRKRAPRGGAAGRGNPARGRGGSVTANGRGRTNSYGQGGQRRNGPSDDGASPSLLGRIGT